MRTRSAATWTCATAIALISATVPSNGTVNVCFIFIASTREELLPSLHCITRSALHRCPQRHGISRLPVERMAEKRKRFKIYEIGYLHVDSCKLRNAEGRLVMPSCFGNDICIDWWWIQQTHG